MFIRLKKVAALLLAALTFSASTTFSMGIHFCGNELESISVVSAAEPCGMAKDVSPCHRKMATSCCEDQTIIHDGDEFSNQVSATSDVVGAQDSGTPVLTLLYNLEKSDFEFTKDLFYDPQPPLPLVDRHIAFHSILI